MSRGLAVALAVGAGALVGMQAPVNSRLGRAVGSVQAASLSFLVGTIALLVIAALARGGLGTYSKVSGAPWWALIGGLLGAVYVTVAILTVRTLGASSLTAAVITGQLVISVAIDRFGLLGIERQPIGAQRILGLVLLVAGVVLMVRR
ncbi:MAG: DMT family transporter [Solirubrobacterales bacterium]